MEEEEEEDLRDDLRGLPLDSRMGVLEFLDIDGRGLNKPWVRMGVGCSEGESGPFDLGKGIDCCAAVAVAAAAGGVRSSSSSSSALGKWKVGFFSFGRGAVVGERRGRAPRGANAPGPDFCWEKLGVVEGLERRCWIVVGWELVDDDGVDAGERDSVEKDGERDGETGDVEDGLM